MSHAVTWTGAVFLDKAQELKSRLEKWHLDGSEPLHMPPPEQFHWLIRRTFRDRVMQGDHDIDCKPAASSTMIDSGFFNDPPRPRNKHLTTWLFRDYVEHLSDAGTGERAKYLRLKLERLLDAPMNRRASCPLGEYIAGREVSSQLLLEFVEAAQAYADSYCEETKVQSDAEPVVADSSTGDEPLESEGESQPPAVAEPTFYQSTMLELFKAAKLAKKNGKSVRGAIHERVGQLTLEQERLFKQGCPNKFTTPLKDYVAKDIPKYLRREKALPEWLKS